MRLTTVLLLAMLPVQALAQRPVSLSSAINAALANGPRIAVARADSSIGRARLAIAREYPNPSLLAGYSKSVPRYHFELEQPLEYSGVRSARERAAEARLEAANFSLAAERATVRFDVEVAYTHAAAAQAFLELSRRNAADGAELLRIARARRNAGDASELDVSVAAVFAGQAQRQAFTDSLDAATMLLQLQALMGLTSTEIQISLSDSLESITPASVSDTTGAGALRVAAARQQLRAERASLQLAERSRWLAPTVRAGIETGDPTGSEPGILPTIGITLPLPIWNRNRGAIAEARASMARATAELQLVDLQTQSALAVAQRERDVTQLKVERGRAIVRDAERVAELATIAYREGEYTLVAVLAAERNARDALRQFISDLEASRVAEAALVRARVVGGPR